MPFDDCTIAPGFIWSGDSFQIGLEALVPGPKKTNNATGFVFQIHFFLDDIFPTTLGKPAEQVIRIVSLAQLSR